MEQVILVELYTGDYYKIISTGSDGYVAKESQKIIDKFNWIDGKNKNDLLWDDKNKKVIEKPQAIIDEEQTKLLLEEKNKILLNNLYKLISESTSFEDFKLKAGM
jgi:hypothetical protein